MSTLNWNDDMAQAGDENERLRARIAELETKLDQMHRPSPYGCEHYTRKTVCSRCWARAEKRITDLEEKLSLATELLKPSPTEADESGETRFQSRAWRDRRDTFLERAPTEKP